MRHNRLYLTAVWAVGTFALTLALALPATLDAVDHPPATPWVKTILNPKVTVHGIELTVKTLGPSTEPSNDTLARSAGPIRLVVVARNISLNSASADFTVQLTSTAPDGPLSRTMSAPKEIWKASDSIVLSPGQTKTLNFTTSAVPPDGMIDVNLLTGEQGITALWLAATTQRAISLRP